MLTLHNISKDFGAVGAVRDVSMRVDQGEFVAIVGPSGCGKTTLLRILAGFETPTGGTVHLNGRDLTALPPQSRRIGMVFQSYALFPHMTVRENIAFGLKAQRRPAGEIRSRTDAAAELVRLAHKLDVDVPLLSGGEQQRVAVARAIVTEPDVLLMDEPLSNLDPVLRDDMRQEIARVQKETGLTTMYVTHDQGEAMMLADRIAVMRNGAVEQFASPRETYFNPANAFVASFMGGAEIVPATLEIGRDGTVARISSELSVSCPIELSGPSIPAGSPLLVAIKPEAVHESSLGARATVRSHAFAGPVSELILEVDGLSLRSRVPALRAGAAPGAIVTVELDPAYCNVFPA